MKFLYLLIILTFPGEFSFTQKVIINCNCPSKSFNGTGKADTMFTFKNGKKIGLCGSIDIESKDIIYSEFILFQCGNTNIISKWDGTQSCKVAKKNDTLFVQQLYGLAIDKNMQIKWVPFYITKYYFKRTSIFETSYFKDDLPKYSSTQIKAAINYYSRLNKNDDGDEILLVAHRLFWAYVSGSKAAGQYLNRFEKKFGPFDGAVAEDFHDLFATYGHFRNE